VTLASQAAGRQDAALRDKVSRLALMLVEEFGSGLRDSSILRRDANVASAFLEVALALSARHGDPAASARALADHIDDVIRRWPALGSHVAGLMSDVVWLLPGDQAVALWRVLLRARENSFGR